MTIANLLPLIDAEIATLKQARALLSTADAPAKRKPGRPAKPIQKMKRKLTPEGRARIAAAVKARWAKQKKAAKG
jgi:hypothetical protein